MNVTVHKSHLQGTVQIPSSKSFVHRQLIASALADASTVLRLNQKSADIEATIHCIRQLGAQVTDNGSCILVEPIGTVPETAALFCGESGSTLRFMLPIAAALGVDALFSGSGRLPQRPNKPLTDAMQQHGVCINDHRLPIHLDGLLNGGEYPIQGNISSQYITGLLLALPLCREDSRIIFTTPLESAAYLDITVDVLDAFGIRIDKIKNGYLVPGMQKYHSPRNVTAEGDWSSAVFWYCANQMGADIRLTGLNEMSCQGDRMIARQLNHLGGQIDVSQTPDSLPALAVASCMHQGKTRFTGAGRLRIKESDRLAAVSAMLRNLGQQVTEENDALTVSGGRPFTGGMVDGCKDHRIVMAAAVAGCFSQNPVVITGAEAVNKSYPRFFEDLKALGGIIHG